jgi:hypothetical protein
VLSVTYNRAPNQPAVSGLSMNPGGACVSGTSRPYVSSLPQLKAVLSDPDTADGEPLTAQFQAYWTPTGGTQQTKTWTSSALANGSTFTYNLADTTSGVPNLPENVVVSWKVRASDGTSWGPWSSDNGSYLCEFVFDKTKPAGPDIDSPEYLLGDAADTTPNCLDDDPTWFDGVGRYTAFTFDSAATDVAAYWWAIDTTPTSAQKLTPQSLGGPVSVLWQPQESKPYTINVIAVDQAGKTSDTSSCVFRVAEGRGPVADWHFDDAAGATSATDATGSFPATPGTTTQFGVAGPQGAPDKAVHLDGAITSGLSTAGPIMDTGKDFTVSAWVRLTDLTRYQTVLSQDGTGEPGFHLGYSAGSAKWYAQIANNDVQALGSWGISGPAAVANQWTHLAATFDTTAQKITLYVDGTLVGTANWRAPWTSHGAFQIGRRLSTTSYSETVNGDIAEVRVYDRVVVPTEAQNLKSQGSVVDRLGYWDLDGATEVTDNPPLVATSSEYGTPQPDGTRIIDKALDLNVYSGGSIKTNENPFDTPQPIVGSGSLVLDGATGYAATAAPVAITSGSFTIAARIKLATNCTTAPMTVLSQPGAHASVFNLACAPDGAGTAVWRITLPDDDQDNIGATVLVADGAIARPDPTLTVGQLLTVTYDAAYQTLKLYVDGNLAGTATGVAIPWTATDNVTDTGDGLHIGRARINSGYSGYLAGVVDEVRVYTGALDPTTISKLPALVAVPEL